MKSSTICWSRLQNMLVHLFHVLVKNNESWEINHVHYREMHILGVSIECLRFPCACEEVPTQGHCLVNFSRNEPYRRSCQGHPADGSVWEPRGGHRRVLIKNHPARRRALSQQWKSLHSQPFRTQKETFLVAIFLFFLEQQCFLFTVYSLRRQLAIMAGFCK